MKPLYVCLLIIPLALAGLACDNEKADSAGGYGAEQTREMPTGPGVEPTRGGEVVPGVESPRQGVAPENPAQP